MGHNRLATAFSFKNMEKLQISLIILQIIVAIMMIVIVLLQKSDGDSLSGIGGGNLNSAISSKASANILTKITMSLIALFMINCLVLAFISAKINKAGVSEIDRAIEIQQNSGQPANKPSPTLPPVE